MKQFFQKITAALDTHSKGYSARKLSAFVVILCIIAAHIAWLKNAFIKDDFNLLEGVLIIDYGFISLCLGMTTYESIKKKPEDPPPAA